MNILGISAFYHDSAAALVQDGEIIAAAQEERFTRVRHDSSFPAKAVAYCLYAGELKLADPPIRSLANGTLRVCVKDRQGNLATVERRFSVGPMPTAGL